MIEFRYFADAHASTASTWTETPRRCDICSQDRPGYDGPYYGEDDVEFVCEECLAAGRLRERGLTTNEGAPGPTAESRAELEEQTPHLVTWQDFAWPVHCGDFCRFEREVGFAELRDLSPEGEAASYLNARLAEDLRGSPLEEDEIPGRAPPSRDASNDPSIYLFSCLVCGEHIFRWDAS